MIELENKYRKEIRQLKNDLSNNQKLINKKVDLIKEEILSSSGNTSDTDSTDKNEMYPDMPFLETEEEAAENIADINERRDTRKEDDTSKKETNLNYINDLVNKIYDYAHENNVVIIDNMEKIYFEDIINFLNDIKDGKINNSNKKKAYKDRIGGIENKIINTKRDSINIKKYEMFISILKKILFERNTSKKEEENNKDGNKKSSGEGLTISPLPILLSELNINS